MSLNSQQAGRDADHGSSAQEADTQPGKSEISAHRNTPGPWFAYGQSFPHEILICTLRACSNYDSPVGESIAWTAKNPFTPGSPSHDEWRAKSLANARLMAASPMMRAALEEIARLDTDMRSDFSVGARQSEIARAALKAVSQ